MQLGRGLKFMVLAHWLLPHSIVHGVQCTILDKSVGMISNFPPPPTQCWSVEIKLPNFRTLRGGLDLIADIDLAVSLKKCLSGGNYRRPSQLLLTRIVVASYFFGESRIAN